MTDNPLGSGGEGIVFRTRRGGFAVKLCNAVGETPVEVDERLKRLRWLPLGGIPICRPLELLAPPHVGYVMELLEDMVALRVLCAPPGDQEDSIWYAAGGGLRRRLVLLAKCAHILATLHDRGIVYSDVSPGNVLVSSIAEHDQVWLVDADNLQTESSAVARRLGTRLYTAPELLRGTTGNTALSDVHSFATMAYEMLTTNHPLIGDFVDEGPAEHEDDAALGLLPWIDHSTDGRNRTEHGYPAELLLTRRLRELFRRTFEEGMADPAARPGAGEWADALHSAADRCVRCAGCPHTFYAARERCPWCGHPRPRVLAVAVLEQLPRLGDSSPVTIPDADLSLVLQEQQPLVVTARSAVRHAVDPTARLLRLAWDGGEEVEVRNVGRGVVRRVPPSGGEGRQLRPGGSATESVHEPWVLHFGPSQHPHRMVAIQPAEASGVS
ncbi:protein kinase domain-containing protein [Amycolatopsis sp. w19]|uniref:protein kinase domain-containing protein n=1 Tax=Amycolatopsis sp. w19 TaxID=3448134 RepID=UPI003F1C6A13